MTEVKGKTLGVPEQSALIAELVSAIKAILWLDTHSGIVRCRYSDHVNLSDHAPVLKKVLEGAITDIPGATQRASDVG